MLKKCNVFAGGGQGKPFPTLNVEALARTIAELNKDDDVPTSAVELDKQRKVSQHVCTHTLAWLSVHSVGDRFGNYSQISIYSKRRNHYPL